MQSVKNKAYLGPEGKITKCSHNSVFNKRLQIPRLRMAMHVSTEPRCGVCDGAIGIRCLNKSPVHSQERSKIWRGWGWRDGMSKPGILSWNKALGSSHLTVPGPRQWLLPLGPCFPLVPRTWAYIIPEERGYHTWASETHLLKIGFLSIIRGC